jgi:hypothetical protein
VCKTDGRLNDRGSLVLDMTSRDPKLILAAVRAELPWGSVDVLPSGKFRLRGVIDGEVKTVGSFETADEALGASELVVQHLVADATNDDDAAKSWVYFIADGVGFIKVGFAKNIRTRMIDIQCGTPHDLTLITQTPGGLRTERTAHGLLAAFHKRGEWFHDTPESRALIEQFVSSRFDEAMAFRKRRQGEFAVIGPDGSAHYWRPETERATWVAAIATKPGYRLDPPEQP